MLYEDQFAAAAWAVADIVADEQLAPRGPGREVQRGQAVWSIADLIEAGYKAGFDAAAALHAELRDPSLPL